MSATGSGTRPEVALERLQARAYTIPTDSHESDGTLEWDSTTIVVVEAEAGGCRGLGYTYAAAAAAGLIEEKLRDAIEDADAMAPQAAWQSMRQATRNVGHPGVTAMAIGAVDSALWDLKARLLELPLVTLLGGVRDEVPVYGSGGFTSYTIERLREQLSGWVAEGIQRVKMKVGRDPLQDPARVHAARQAIGPNAELFVDANGAYTRKQALALAERFREEAGVSWFEEPVSSDDPEGLRLLRDRCPAGMEIAAGEYGFELVDFRRLLEMGSVDVLQADGTRCCGITGLLAVGALCEAHGLPLSAHCAPAFHCHPCAAIRPFVHLEYFHDHVRIEHMLFDGVVDAAGGALRPDRSRPGNGLEFKHADAERWAV